MDPWNDLHSWREHYREEVLRETHRRHLARQAETNYSPRPVRASANSAWRGLVALLRGVGLSG
jgi:hypothetical protein